MDVQYRRHPAIKPLNGRSGRDRLARRKAIPNGGRTSGQAAAKITFATPGGFVPDIDHGPVTLSDLDGRDFAEVWEVATITRSDNRTIRQRCREGTIPSVKIGAEYRIPVAWLRRAASGQPVGGAA
jgi:hypothetical protein